MYIYIHKFDLKNTRDKHRQRKYRLFGFFSSTLSHMLCLAHIQRHSWSFPSFIPRERVMPTVLPFISALVSSINLVSTLGKENQRLQGKIKGTLQRLLLEVELAVRDMPNYNGDEQLTLQMQELFLDIQDFLCDLLIPEKPAALVQSAMGTDSSKSGKRQDLNKVRPQFLHQLHLSLCFFHQLRLIVWFFHQFHLHLRGRVFHQLNQHTRVRLFHQLHLRARIFQQHHLMVRFFHQLQPRVRFIRHLHLLLVFPRIIPMRASPTPKTRSWSCSPQPRVRSWG